MSRVSLVASANRVLIVLLLLSLLPSFAADAANEALLKRKRDGSRSTAVHHIILYDADGDKISVDDDWVLPFSSRFTCGECHDYEVISRGWHFNAPSASSIAGRPGEPWILTDERTGTQLPVSSRSWEGTWRPADIGLSPWRFVKAFGSHMPGGGMGEMEADPPDFSSRWDLSGKLEINCLACHSGSPMQDQSEWAIQIARENFAWAATAASALATTRGAVVNLPDMYDIYAGRDPDNPQISPPSVELNSAYLDKDGKAFFDILVQPPADRCYACHSTARAGEGAREMWETDEDVHLTAGLTCADCHRNGLDHWITRGYRNETRERGVRGIATLSCEGCHLGHEAAQEGTTRVLLRPGRLGAPRPLHKGLTPIHLEKMTCTACHSGPWPEEQARLVRTSRAHRLGIQTASEEGKVLPYIVSPVFAKSVSEDGKIAPHNMTWPSFWGLLRDDDVTPLVPDKVSATIGTVLQAAIEGGSGGVENTLTEENVAKALAALTEERIGEGEPVYVSGGRLFRLGADGTLVASDHRAAHPYAWPIAHDVRPANQSLGSGGCPDCHTSDAPFFFGIIEATGPLRTAEIAATVAYELQEIDPTVTRLFGWTFRSRRLLKTVGFCASALVFAVLLLYGLAGLRVLCRRLGQREY